VALDILPGGRDELPFPAIVGCATHHACQFEIPGQAGSGHIGGANDNPSAAAAQLNQNLGMEDTSGRCAGNRVVASGILRQRRCTIKRIGEHTRIGQQDIVVAAGATETRKGDVLIGIEIHAERRDDAGMKPFVPETFVKFHCAPIR